MSGKESMLIRLGGAALLVAFAIHIVANDVLKEWPPSDPTLAELRLYLEAEASTWAIVHGMRYAAIACFVLFFSGLFVRIRALNGEGSGGWEYVGLLGGMLHLSNLLVANGIETFAFLDFEWLSENPELFWLVFHTTRVLFNAEIVTWAITIFGFSMAGWLSGSLPKPISITGFFAAATGMISGVTVAAAMTDDGLLGTIFTIAALSSLLWYVCTGSWLLWRGDR